MPDCLTIGLAGLLEGSDRTSVSMILIAPVRKRPPKTLFLSLSGLGKMTREAPLEPCGTWADTLSSLYSGAECWYRDAVRNRRDRRLQP